MKIYVELMAKVFLIEHAKTPSEMNRLNTVFLWVGEIRLEEIIEQEKRSTEVQEDTPDKCLVMESRYLSGLI
jgi:hypothetical protein